MNFLKGFRKVAPGASSAARQASQRLADRAALNAGAKYIDIGNPNKAFNSSGFLPKSAK
jgi:hypothetical protein